MNNQISLLKAIEMTTRYRANKVAVLAPGISNNILSTCETFPILSVTGLLSQAGAEFLRIYYGMDEELNIHAILVVADANGKDMIPALLGATGADVDSILEEASRCPPLCPESSPLNS